MEQNACSSPLTPKRKWKLWDDDQTVDVYGAMSRLHTRLAPYFEMLAVHAHGTGIPIMRHPFLLHPREPEAWRTESAFYLGPSLYTAPVVERGARTKDVWLPPGKWIDLVDLVVYEGGRRVTIPAPLEKLPLLLADGGIVPMLDASIETLAPATDASVVTPETVADRLDVVVALSAGRDARLVLADGTELVARRLSARAAPSGLPAGDPQACTDGCVEDTPGRVRLSTPLVDTHDVAHDDLVLTARGPRVRRVRWDVFRLP
jgi:alpha-D-xyloside xylohydrolase